MVIDCAGKPLDLTSPRIMGVLNVTPDSFSDGGQHFNKDQLRIESAVAKAQLMVEQGADIIDIGGESTRPGAEKVSAQQECDRVLPVLEAIVSQLDVIVSVDTSTPELMTQAANMGAGLLNDVRALRREGALQAAAETGLPVCLMHMQGEPDTMQAEPQYDDVIVEVRSFLAARKSACIHAGIPEARILFDPGFGFGKYSQHNLALLAGLPALECLGPLLVGLSRKSLIGQITGKAVDKRLAGSVALALMAIERGASIVRVHDVDETRDAIRLWSAVQEAG